MRAPMLTSLSTKNSRDSNIFSCIRITPRRTASAVTIAIDIRSAGERRPRLIFKLRDVATEVALHQTLLIAGHDEVISFHLARDP